jgi:hypothetical protein
MMRLSVPLVSFSLFFFLFFFLYRLSPVAIGNSRFVITVSRSEPDKPGERSMSGVKGGVSVD